MTLANVWLTCFLIACVYVPFLLAVTRDPGSEVRRVTNALIVGRAERIFRAETALARWKHAWPEAERWRRSVDATAPTVSCAVEPPEVP